MKKLISINIAGKIFQINDDAYTKLSKYLKHLENHFSKEIGGEEILEDLEGRMSEILDTKTKQALYPVDVKMVGDLIETIGDPSQFDESHEPNSGNQSQQQGRERKYEARPEGKKLFRDPDDKIVFGVCSGLAYYFNLDVLIVRIFFVVAAFFGLGSPVVFYILLAFLIPKAHTYAEKARMTQK